VPSATRVSRRGLKTYSRRPIRTQAHAHVRRLGDLGMNGPHYLAEGPFVYPANGFEFRQPNWPGTYPELEPQRPRVGEPSAGMTSCPVLRGDVRRATCDVRRATLDPDAMPRDAARVLANVARRSPAADWTRRLREPPTAGGRGWRARAPEGCTGRVLRLPYHFLPPPPTPAGDLIAGARMKEAAVRSRGSARK
jgi:hypothetical protein